MKWKLINILSCLVLLLAIGLLSFATYLMIFDTPNPIIFKNIPFPTDKERYYPGDSISVYVVFEKYTYAVPEITVSIVDGMAYTGPKFILQIGGDNSYGEMWINNELIIPLSIPPGRYRLIGTAKYKINTLRTVIVPFRSKYFNILERTHIMNMCLVEIKNGG